MDTTHPDDIPLTPQEKLALERAEFDQENAEEGAALENPALNTLPEEEIPAPEWDEIKDKKDGYRFSQTFAHFIYRFHLDKTKLKHLFVKLNKSKPLREFHAAHETGDVQTPYEHTHVIVDFGRPLDKRGCRFADFKLDDEDPRVLDTPEAKGIVHPCISRIKGRDHWGTLCVYLAKEDPENAHLLVENKEAGNWATQIWRMESLTKALQWATTPGIANVFPGLTASAVKLVWEAQPVAEALKSYFLPVTWQAETLVRLEGPGNPRYVNWYVDEGGACGKSSLCNEILDRYPKDAVVIDAGGLRVQDIARCLKNARSRGNSLRILVFDFPRTCEETTSLYTMMETVGNGRITSGKYDSDSFRFACEHILCFANFKPKFGLLSADRWYIRTLRFEDPRGSQVAWHEWRSFIRTYDSMDPDKLAMEDYMPNITQSLGMPTKASRAASQGHVARTNKVQGPKKVIISAPEPSPASMTYGGYEPVKLRVDNVTLSDDDLRDLGF